MWIKASLRIISESLTADEIADRFGLRGNHEPRDPLGRPGIWLWLSTEPETASLDKHLDHLIEIAKTDTAAFRTLVGTGAIAQMFIGIGPEEEEQISFSVSPSVLSDLALLPVELVFDVYPGVTRIL